MSTAAANPSAPTPAPFPVTGQPRAGGLSISKRVAEMKPSVTVAFMNRAKNMKAQGHDVLSFAAGEPDFDTPQVVKDAAIEALNKGMTKYMPTLGDPETKKVLAEKMVKENGIPTTADHIAISAGGKHSLYVVCQCLFDFPAPGEEAQEGILPVPAWVSYAPIIEVAGGKVLEIQTSAASDFKITPEQLKKAITHRTRAFFINSPSNPCGTMYTPAELKALAQVIAEAAKTTAPNLVVVSDELYEKIVYGGIEHFSIGSVPEIAERTLTINGLSKAYAMTGWRIGYAAGSGAFGKKLIDAMGVLQGQMTTNITSFTYPAIRAAITKTGTEVEKMRQAFADRASAIYARLVKVPGFICPKPTGAFYAFPDVSAHFGKTSAGGNGTAGRKINNAMDFCEALLAEHYVAFVPGEDFGGCGKNCVRISFACSIDQINKGIDRVEKFIAGLR
ncbi:MAG: pyridoxal phosphate-dependent aminotransferase [Planctomycetes bacterium]|nr:pyridoxal phosphate-dependent aminotransferase [Planctomycetota bacterium]